MKYDVLHHQSPSRHSSHCSNRDDRVIPRSDDPSWTATLVRGRRRREQCRRDAATVAAAETRGQLLCSLLIRKHCVRRARVVGRMKNDRGRGITDDWATAVVRTQCARSIPLDCQVHLDAFCRAASSRENDRWRLLCRSNVPRAGLYENQTIMYTTILLCAVYNVVDVSYSARPMSTR